MKNLLLLILLTCISISASAQKVGVVLSGGGATAAAHIGFLKVLEDNQIPIDYITGTSMGALIAGLYASGYSPEQIEAIVLSEEFTSNAAGESDEAYRYFFKEDELDASLGTLKFSRGKLISSSIPTNLINSVQLDYGLMELFGPVSASVDYDFDKLFIPFRCVASDIEAKESVVFKSGNLATSIRASMTYPFYLEPIEVDGKILFDGGLYNNFPSDVLYNDFHPDVIIGSNVSENSDPPEKDDILSLLKNMMKTKTNFEEIMDKMIIVEPNLDVGTFDFKNMKQAVNTGYVRTEEKLDEILSMVESRTDSADLAQRRMAFQATWEPLVFNYANLNGLDKSQRSYVSKIIGRKKKEISSEEMKQRYFRLFSDDKIESVYPSAVKNVDEQGYTLNLDVKKDDDIFFSIGGNFSSRPINMGYVGLKYNLFGKNSTTLYANSYFGKFYGSVKAGAQVDLSTALPVSIEPYVTMNRWDYFRSFATFFEDVKPSFLVINEKYGGLKVSLPVGSAGRIQVDGNYAQITDNYYQTEEFLSVDTADKTVFQGFFANVGYERSTLNRKFWPSKGTYLKVSFKQAVGEELIIPGTTSLFRDTTENQRQWIQTRLQYENYFQSFGPIQLGFKVDAVASTQQLSENFISSLMTAPYFSPIPESKTLFINELRAYNYAGAGAIVVAKIGNNVDWRTEAYGFASYGRIVQDRLGQPLLVYDYHPEVIGSSSLIYHSPIGPLSVSANYFEANEEPWSFLFNFGYLIFNRSVRTD